MTIDIAHQNLVEMLIPEFGKGEAQQMARIVFEDAFSITNFLRKDSLTTEQITRLEDMGIRLVQHEPVQYVVGMTYFYDLKFKVNTAVLIPRPETEELVDWILKDHAPQKNLSILDIGTGSGCIPITIKAKAPNCQLSAFDISAEALKVARENAKDNAVEVNFQNIDILEEENWEQLPSYDIIVSNPPYIPNSQKELMSPNVLAYEPEIALFVSNEDPLIFYRTIIDFAKKHLVVGGWLYFETNEYNLSEVEVLFSKASFSNIEKRKDLQGKDRMVRAQLGAV